MAVFKINSNFNGHSLQTNKRNRIITRIKMGLSKIRLIKLFSLSSMHSLQYQMYKIYFTLKIQPNKDKKR